MRHITHTGSVETFTPVIPNLHALPPEMVMSVIVPLLICCRIVQLGIFSDKQNIRFTYLQASRAIRSSIKAKRSSSLYVRTGMVLYLLSSLVIKRNQYVRRDSVASCPVTGSVILNLRWFAFEYESSALYNPKLMLYEIRQYLMEHVGIMTILQQVWKHSYTLLIIDKFQVYIHAPEIVVYMIVFGLFFIRQANVIVDVRGHADHINDISMHIVAVPWKNKHAIKAVHCLCCVPSMIWRVLGH